MKTLREIALKYGFSFEYVRTKCQQMGIKPQKLGRKRLLYLSEIDSMKIEKLLQSISIGKKAKLSNNLEEMYLKMAFFFNLQKMDVIRIRTVMKKKKLDNPEFDELGYIQKLYVNETQSSLNAKLRNLDLWEV